MFKDYYSILNIGPFSSAEEIKRAYKSQMKIWHPDINKSSNSHNVSVDIQEAYQILSNIEKRRLYDGFYFTHYLRKEKNGPYNSRDIFDEENLKNIIKDTQREAKIFISKGYKHFINFINKGVSFFNYLFFLFAAFWVLSMGVAVGIGFLYPVYELIIIEPLWELEKYPSVSYIIRISLFSFILISIGSYIIYKTVKFVIYKLKNGPDSY